MKNFYHGKRILITGSTGFKGSWLSFWLHYLGAEVIGFGLEPGTEPNIFSALHVDKKIHQVIGDINIFQDLKKTFNDFQPEIVFHLAAQPLVRESYREPLYTMMTNCMGTVHVLEMIRNSDFVKGAVLITTDKVYKNGEFGRPFQENDELGGNDPYSASKAMAELAIHSYITSFLQKNKKIVIGRAGNIIGGGDWSSDRIMTDVVNGLYKNEKIILRNPSAVRPWQYVLEALDGYMKAGEKMFEDDKYCGAYNFGPDAGNVSSVFDLVSNCIKIQGTGQFEIDDSLTFPETKTLLLDNSKAKKMLSWTPKYDLNTVLEKTLNWYSIFYSHIEKLEEATINEINQFIK